MLQTIYTQLLAGYTRNEQQVQEYWRGIETAYSGRKRHYHTLSHLSYIIEQLEEVKEQILDWNTLLFSAFYHDVVYSVTAGDNEEKSAASAAQQMTAAGVPRDRIERCQKQIVATKQHELSPDGDTNYLLDADLSVLGQDWNSYLRYAQSIRKEYAVFPSFLYNRGRKKVLEHFLAMDNLYKTEHFRNKFEIKAKENMSKELLTL